MIGNPTRIAQLQILGAVAFLGAALGLLAQAQARLDQARRRERERRAAHNAELDELERELRRTHTHVHIAVADPEDDVARFFVAPPTGAAEVVLVPVPIDG